MNLPYVILQYDRLSYVAGAITAFGKKGGVLCLRAYPVELVSRCPEIFLGKDTLSGNGTGSTVQRVVFTAGMQWTSLLSKRSYCCDIIPVMLICHYEGL